MIVEPKPSLWQLFGAWRLSILPRILPQLVSILLWASVVTWFSRHYPALLRSWTVAPFTLLGVALSIFLGFRNSACYDRWWEARRQLGALVGEARSFARISVGLSRVDLAERQGLVRETAAYADQLMQSLRSTTTLPSHQNSVNAPDMCLRHISLRLSLLLERGQVDAPVYKLLEERLVAFAGYQVACERIRTTPTPYTYTLLIYRTAYAYCFLLPCGLVTSMGWATPLFSALVAYAFFGLDALGDELEDPFGDHFNALPLRALARTIERSLLETIGASDIPEPVLPIDSILG